MFVTSSTTAVAFLSNAFSPLMPIKAFGYYAAIIVLINYVLVIFLFPSAVIIFENQFAHKPFCCCCRVKTKKEPENGLSTDEAGIIKNGGANDTNTTVN